MRKPIMLAAACLSMSLMADALPYETEAATVTVYGQRIHYRESGQGRPIVLLHGLWGGNNEWEAIVSRLSEQYRVIAMDMIGFHGSSKPDVQYHNALLSQFLAGFIDALELDNVILMGHAMGANTATYTAVHHPKNISALILIDGAGYRSADRDLAAAPSEAMIRFQRVATGSSLAATRGLLERRVSDTSLVSEAWVTAAFSMWVDSAGAIRDMLTEGGDLSDEEMQGINLPVLVVWGAEDNVFSPDNAARLHADIANSTLHVIEGSGHLPQVERPAEFIDTVTTFLDTMD